MRDSRRLPPLIPLAVAAMVTFSSCGQDPAGAPTLPIYGDLRCERYAEIEVDGQYMVQNALFNDAAASQVQCVTALWDGDGARAGFSVSPIDIAVDGAGSASYPSIVLGWHWGTFHGVYTTARTVDSLTSVRSTWSYTLPAGADARYNASYVLYLHPDASPRDPTGGVELMVWIATRDASPVGAMVGVVTLADTDWEVWAGPHEGWTAVTYKRVSNATSADLDLLPFVGDAAARGYGQGDWHFLSVEAGFEIWRASQPFGTGSYVAEIR